MLVWFHEGWDTKSQACEIHDMDWTQKKLHEPIIIRKGFADQFLKLHVDNIPCQHLIWTC
jgi:hypothetical protein